MLFISKLYKFLTKLTFLLPVFILDVVYVDVFVVGKSVGEKARVSGVGGTLIPL